MRIFGGIVVALYAWLMFSGYEPFSSHERGILPPDARHGPGGILSWHSGFHGGK